MGCVCVYKQKMAQRYWWEHGDEKTRKNSLDEKRSFSLCFFSCKTLEQKFNLFLFSRHHVPTDF